MTDDYRPDVKVAETYVRHGDGMFRVLSFERDSSTTDRSRFQETHVFVWDEKARAQGEWVGQHYGHGIGFHCVVVTAYAEHGKYDDTEETSSWEKTQKILDYAVRAAMSR